MPDELKEWLDTIRHLLLHIRERYGEEEVSQWMITPFADIFLVRMFSISLVPQAGILPKQRRYFSL